MKMKIKNEISQKQNHAKKICGICKSEMGIEEKFCPKCGKEYRPLICGKCNQVVNIQTKFCPSCGERVKSEKEKKQKKILIISSVTSVVALLIVSILVLFLPYTEYKDCIDCEYGKRECRVKYYQELLEGKPIYNHDCSKCVNGTITCADCNGMGFKSIETTRFKEIFE